MRRDDSSRGARSGLIYDCDIFVLISYESILLTQKAGENQNKKLKINQVFKKLFGVETKYRTARAVRVLQLLRKPE